jgi:alkyl sulfatase BDS1-like metallo-beta-lactamase superfamily hydrolase
MRRKKPGYMALSFAFIFILGLIHMSSVQAAEPRDASAFTKKANEKVLKALPFKDKQDFEDAQKGFIAKLPNTVIRDAKGNIVWDMDQYSFLDGEGAMPGTVNPSLWRQAQLNNFHGLFKVADHNIPGPQL